MHHAGCNVHEKALWLVTWWAGAIVLLSIIHDLSPCAEARRVTRAIGRVGLKDHVPRVDAEGVVAEVAAVPRVVPNVIPDLFTHFWG